MIVTKTRSIEDISELIKLGYRNFAENRVQEAYKKYTNIKSDHKINLSLIGPLQSNKVKQALTLFDTIQSIDRNKIVDEIKKNDAIVTNEKGEVALFSNKKIRGFWDSSPSRIYKSSLPSASTFKSTCE